MFWLLLGIIVVLYFIILFLNLDVECTEWKFDDSRYSKGYKKYKREPRPQDVRKAMLWPVYLILGIIKVCFHVTVIIPIRVIKILSLASKRNK